MPRILVLGLIVSLWPVVSVAQNPPSSISGSSANGNGASMSQIADAIRRSGLSQDQVRARLQAAGFDPKMSDPYFTGGVPTSFATADSSRVPDEGFVGALRALGLIETDLLERDTNTGAADTVRDRVPTRPTRTGRQVFGMDVFSAASSAFDAVVGGPVDASYRLGVGDQVQLIITGDMEMAAGLDVRRDGTILIPQIGQVAVAGLTVEAARTTVKQRAARVYSVIAEGRARVDLSISRVRNNQIFVIGEVERPGSYQINALGTVFRALAVAGGPTVRGSFRNVEVRRGGVAVAQVDLYDYLLRGDASKDIRTEQGDIVFVPLSKRLVTLQGAVRRPGIYEVRDGEHISRLLEFGGGLLSTAATDRVQIDRTLPPAERSPGKERALIDISFKPGVASLDTVQLYDGDVITVFSVGEVRRNRVVLKGEVFEPGMYEWAPGMTLGQLVGKAQGFLPWALTDRIKIARQIPYSGRSELYSVSIQDSVLDKIPLQEFDEITVLDARPSYPAGTVAISGSVLTPAERPFVENMTVRDLIDLAGGLKPEAAVVELARKKLTARYSDTAAVINTFQVLPGGRLDPEASRTILTRGDRINVRDFPGYRTIPRTVTLAGLFTYPGTYVLRSDAERVSDVVRRAAGLLPSAYPSGARLTRDGRPVAIDLNKALRGDKSHNIFLAQGDRLEVGPDPSVIYVSGAVERQVIVPFHAGWEVEDYISAAGGYSADADKGNIVLEYPSGEIRSTRRSFFRTIGNLPVISGSTITVAQKPDNKGTNSGEILTRTVQVVTTLVSLIIGYKTVTH